MQHLALSNPAAGDARLDSPLQIPKSHLVGISSEPQEVLDVLAKKIPFLFRSQGRNETDQSALAYAVGEQRAGAGVCSMLLGLKTPTKVFCKRRTDIDAPNALLIFLANAGHFSYMAKKDERGVAPGGVFVSRAADLANFTLFPGTEWTRMVIPGSDVTSALHALGIEDIVALPVFDAVVPRPLAATVQQTMQRLIWMSNTGYSQRSIDYAWRQMRENITLALLIDLPHSLTDVIIRGQQRGASPRQVNRAIEFIEQFADHEISLNDIAIAAQCSPRNLSRLFREITGTTPMSALRELRLDRARAQIIGRPQQALGEIALQWGFCHSGQFSQHYRRKFGESPSDTRLRH